MDESAASMNISRADADEVHSVSADSLLETEYQ
jgi:hypothetical protein